MALSTTATATIIPVSQDVVQKPINVIKLDAKTPSNSTLASISSIDSKCSSSVRSSSLNWCSCYVSSFIGTFFIIFLLIMLINAGYIKTSDNCYKVNNRF